MKTKTSQAPGVETKKTYCRICHNYCAMEVDVLDGKPIAVRGDTSDLGGRVTAVTKAETSIQQGVCSLAHGWGFHPDYDDNENVREIGASSNRLISDEAEYDPISGMARQSAIPVTITAL